jgi:asparagine synthase (glutamine-hydrolysing)
MASILPEAIVQRKEKVGFEPPQFNWMQQPRLQEYMQEAKRKMVKAGILNTNVLDKQVVPKHAHEAANYHWRYLCVAHLM